MSDPPKVCDDKNTGPCSVVRPGRSTAVFTHGAWRRDGKTRSTRQERSNFVLWKISLSDEYLQTLTPDRHGTLIDAFEKVAEERSGSSRLTRSFGSRETAGSSRSNPRRPTSSLTSEFRCGAKMKFYHHRGCAGLADAAPFRPVLAIRGRYFLLGGGGPA